MGEGACCQCSHPGCYKTYHPLCAKFSDCYSHYVKRPEGFERVSYCPSHTPANMVLNKELGIWIKAVSRRPLPMGLRELLVIRKDFDRARTLVDLVRKRAKIARRVFELEHEVFEGKRVEYEPKAGRVLGSSFKESSIPAMLKSAPASSALPGVWRWSRWRWEGRQNLQGSNLGM